jgi:predicted short-subunit dehydrogenase-like oxidoreductase (DUF2520 family)
MSGLSVTIIGQGKVGRAFEMILRNGGVSVNLLPGRTLNLAHDLSGIILLTVPDDVIASVGSKIANHLTQGTVVAHCSGVLESAVLGDARSRGCAVASFHPLQTFPTVEAAVRDLPKAVIVIEGDTVAVEALRSLGKSIAKEVLVIPPGTKALYHAAAVLASNFTVTLLAAAERVAKAAGIPSLDAFMPLIEATVANVRTLGPAQALTGPISRGDSGTVAKHLEALSSHQPHVVALYLELARLTVDLAEKGGKISEQVAQRLERELERKD